MLSLRNKLLVPSLLTALLSVVGIIYISVLHYNSFQQQAESQMIGHEQQLRLFIRNIQENSYNLVELLSNEWRFLDSLSAGKMDVLLNELTPFHDALQHDFIGVYDKEGIIVARGDSPGHFGMSDNLYQNLREAEKGTSVKSIVILYNNKLLLLELKRLETIYGPIGFLAVGQYLDEEMVNSFGRAYNLYLAFQYGDSNVVSSNNIQLPRNVDQNEFRVEFTDLFGQDSPFSAILWQDNSKTKSKFLDSLLLVLFIIILMGSMVIFLSRKIVMDTVNDLDKARSQAEEELLERKRIEEELKKLNEELEVRVQERTKVLQKENIERKRAEKKLKQSEHYFRSLLHSLHEDILVIGLDYRITDVNDVFLASSELKREDVIGRHCFEVLHDHNEPCDAYGNKCPLKEILATGESRSCRHQHKYADGLKRWSAIIFSPLRDEEGKVIQVVEAGRDITDLINVEEELVESEKQHRLLVENANDAIFITQDGVIKFPNPKTKELSGYSQEELSTIPFVNHVHPDDRDMIVDLDNRRLAGKEFPSTFSCKMVNKSGKQAWAQISTVPVTWEGKPATLNFLRDITNEKSLENRLFQTQKAEAMGTLAGGIAHDFNNILFPIVGFAEMVIEDISHASPLRGPLSEVIAGAKRARDLVKQILAFSHQSDQDLKPLKIQPILNEALKVFGSTLPTTVEIKQDICKDCGMVMADPTQIHEICLNLTSNAYHAMEDNGGTISVALKEVDLAPDNLPDLKLSPGRYVCLTVADTGAGMDNSIMEKIFDPYFTTKGKHKGAGLGLSAVQGIIKGYNGEIVVKSELGKGTEFKVYLPRILSEAETHDGIKPVTLTSGNERILLVDAEEPIARMLKLNLERIGYQVSLCNSSTDALETFSTSPNKYDLVITDMSMPNITGDNLTIELKKIRPDIPVILCTGFSKKLTNTKASAIGIDVVLMKPVVGDELARAIKSILDGKR